jgi:GDPmannose 4,6-dehydratase
VAIDQGLRRPTDIAVSRGNPSKARERLGWVAKHKIADIVRLISRLERIGNRLLSVLRT